MITIKDIDAFMKTPLDMAREYQETTQQNAPPSLYDKLIAEEYSEWVLSVLDPKENQLKELADMVYVIYGYANAIGWDLDEALLRVHENNMGRMLQPDGTIKRREDGKIVKNPDYPKVNLGDLV